MHMPRTLYRPPGPAECLTEQEAFQRRHDEIAAKEREHERKQKEKQDKLEAKVEKKCCDQMKFFLVSLVPRPYLCKTRKGKANRVEGKPGSALLSAITVIGALADAMVGYLSTKAALEVATEASGGAPLSSETAAQN